LNSRAKRSLNHMGFQGIQSLRLGFSSSGTSSLWAFIIYPTLITLKAMGLSPESRLAELCAYDDF